MITKKFSLFGLPLLLLALLFTSNSYADTPMEIFNGKSAVTFSCDTLYAGEAGTPTANARVFKIDLSSANGTSVGAIPLYRATSMQGLLGEPMSTVALGPWGGSGGALTMYHWYWGNPFSVTYVKNGDTSNVKLLSPSAPYPGTGGYNYWSGGEVFQKTGEIYFSGGEDSTFSNNFRMMKFNPVTGTYVNSGRINPQTSSDNIVDNLYIASDMAIDADGNAYLLVGTNDTDRWLVRILVSDTTGAWTYNLVSKIVGIGASTDIWGMAFLNGDLYATSGAYNRDLYKINVISGQASFLGRLSTTSGNTGTNANVDIYYIDDLAACQTAPVIKGSVYNDVNGDGSISSDDKVAGQTVELWKVETGTPTFKASQTTSGGGDYSFIVDSTSATYYIRLVQPKINTINAVQTWATASNSSLNPVTAYCYNPANATTEGHTADGACRGANYTEASAKSGSPDSWNVYSKITMNSDSKVAEASFALTTVGNFGDAPATYNDSTSPAKHLSPGSDGATPTDSINWLRLGDLVSYQSGPKPDNNANSITSHDGVQVLLKNASDYISLQNAPLAAGNTYKFKVKTTGPASSKGFLNAWVDWSTSQKSNSFVGATALASDQAGVQDGYVTFDYTVPSGSARGLDATFARFRLSTTKGLGPNNNNLPTPSSTVPWIVDGEVEDYRLYIIYGDVKLSAVTKGGVGQFDYSISNTISTSPSSNTDSIVTSVEGTKVSSSALHAFTALNQSIVITQTLPSEDWETVSAECLVDGKTNILTTLSGNVLTIPASSVIEGADISCTFTNGLTPKIELAKTVAGTRLKTADQFTVQLKDGSTVSASATTTGTATTATTGSTKVKGDGTVYTLDEIMATGSSNPLARYDASMTCSNTYTTSSTTLPSGSGKSFSVTPGYGDNITCTLTNTRIDASASSSTIVADPISIIADGVAESTITVQLKDSNNNDITSGGDKVEILFTDTANKVGVIGGVAANNSAVAQDNGDGTYTIKVTSTKLGSDKFTFKVNDVAAPTTKTAEVTYTSGTVFDQTKSTIVADPTTIDADGVATSTVSVTMYYASNTDQLLTGYTGLELARKDGTAILGTVTYIGETDGVYSFSVKSATRGSDEFVFKTSSTTSTKSATVTYAAGSVFDQTKSTIVADPTSIDADGVATSTVSVTMYYASDSSKLLTGYTGLELARKDGTAILGTVTYIGETDGVYSFSVKSATRGSDEFVFKTSSTTSTKSATVTYAAGSVFDQTKSTIVADPTSIDADGVATSTVSVTMYYASDSSKLLTGYTGLELARKDGTAILGTVTYIGETDGVYSFSVKSATRGSDEFVFKTSSTTSTKSATVTYAAGSVFDQTKSTIVADPTTIDADGVATSTVSVTMYYASDSSKLLTGYTGLELARKDGTAILGTVTYIGETDGVYSFSVKSATRGSDEFVFKTSSTTSTKSATVTYAAGSVFDQTKSTIVAEPATIDADGVATSTVSVTMYYASDSSKLLTGYTGLELARKDGTAILGTVTYIGETDGVYSFSVKSATRGSDEFVFKTSSTTSTKSATVTYAAGSVFDQTKSTIVADPTTIDADGVATSTVSVTMYYASDSSKLLTGYTGLELARKDGTAILGTVTYIGETDGVYSFSVKSATRGSDEFVFKTSSTTSTKSATVTYAAGSVFDQTKSTIVADPTSIDADGVATSTVSVTMYYASDSSKLLTGYTGLELARKDGTAILGTVTYIGETDGVYSFSVKSATRGSDEFVFKTTSTTSTKSATVTYTAGTEFDQTKSTIVAEPATIDADGVATSTVSVTMYYASDSSKLLTGYTGLELARKDGTAILGTVTYIGETDGVYSFSVKSATRGSDEFVFKTSSTTSTKSATVTYAAGSVFDQTKSTIVAEPATIDADGVAASTVSVTMYYASDSSKLLTGYTGLELARKDGTAILGTVTYIGETDGVYSFSVKSATRGSDEFVFKTSSTTSTKSATVTYAAGSAFDQTKSTIVAEPATIDADGVAASTVSVTMYYASDSSKLLTGYTGLELARKDGTAILGTVTYIGETDGVYSFSVKSATRGSDEFVFKTSSTTSTKSATVTYTAGTEFDQTKSTIVAEPATIDADGVATSTVSVTMYYASDSSKLLTGYTGLELARKDGGAIVGTVTYIGETDGVYSFSVKSATRGSDEFVFKTSTSTSTKSATVTYAAGSVFDQTKSTIVAEPTTIDADGVTTSTVSVTMYYASDSSKLLTGYTGLELARKDGTAILGTVTYIGETDGVYSFSVKSATRGSDEFVFKTTSTTSTKSATVTYAAGSVFDQTKSTIVANPGSIDADGVATSTVSVTMYYASDSSKLLTGYTGLELARKDGTAILGTVTYIGETDGVYSFSVKSATRGSDEFVFKTSSTTSTKSATVTYTIGAEFDQSKSTIVADPATIDSDGVAASTVSVTMYYASDSSKLLTGYTGLELARKDGGAIVGTVTYIGETDGVYSFSVKSATRGSDEFVFKTTSTTSTKSATVTYVPGDVFDQTKSTIVAEPTTIDADGVATSTVSVTMYYASDSSKLLTGYTGLELARKDGTAILGTVTYIGETDGVYSFSVKSATRGSDEFVFKTSSTTSTKSATVTYAAGSVFDQTKSTIVAEPTTIDADGVATSTVSVTMYYASDSSKLLTGYTGLELARKDGTAILGTVTYIGETDGVYSFSVKSATRGSDEFVFKTSTTTSTKSATVTYVPGDVFDQTKSTIVAEPATIDADGVATSTVSVTMYYASDSSKLLTGYTGLELARKDGTAILGTVTYIGETDGVYSFSVKSATRGSDEFVFKTSSTTSTKSATVTYTAGTEFDQTKSTIVAEPATIDADGVAASTVSVTMYYASDSSKLLTGYTGLELARKDGTAILGTVTYIGETDGVYSFSVKSATRGSDEFVFKTSSTTSTKSATVTYTAGTEFDQTKSTIVAEPATIDADGVATSTVSVTMYYASDSSKLLTGYTGLELARKDGTAILGTVTYIGETDGVYSFSVKSATRGSDEFVFKTSTTTSTKSATVTYTAGTEFDQTKSTIVAEPATIDADGVATSTVSVTMYYASDSSKLLTGYTGLELARKDGTAILGTVTYIGETDGVYSFSVKSATRGSDEFVFKTTSTTSTKSATVTYTAGTEFDQTKSTIVAEPATIDADGVATSTVSVTMYYASDSSKLLTGYTGLELARKDGTAILGTVTYIGETDGVYSFSVKSATRGSDEFVFKTSTTTSTKSATVTYTAGTEFDQTKSTIVAEPATIDADGVATSTVSVTMYYASDSSKLLTGYTGLELARKDGTAILGTVTYIGETDGVYSFSVKSATRGSDEFVFKTTSTTSTKSATVTYTAGTEFDQTKSTIVAEPATIDADGVATSTVSVTMYYASDSSKLLTGYTGLELARKDGGAIVGTVTYIGETDGVYSFSVKSATRGSDEFVFKTTSTTSTKSATVTYVPGDVFDQTKSTIVADPTTIDADGVATSTVSVTMYYASDSSKLLTGYTGLELARKDGTAILGTVTYIGETDGVYSFSVKSATRGSDEFVFKTSSTTSTKSATVTYTAGTEFDQTKSTIVAEPATIDADGVATSTVSVTMYYASDSSKLLTGYTGLELARKDGTAILGTVTYIGETDGVYSFSVKSATRGSDEFVFKTSTTTSTKSATVTYVPGDVFDQTKSTIVAEPATIDADGVATSTVSVTMYYASDSSKLLTGYTGLELARKDGGAIVGTVTYIGETDGVYSFSVKSATRGSDEFVFKTTSTTSTKSATVTYTAGTEFDQTKSTIVAEPATIDADGVATSTVSVTMYYASDSSKLLTGYTGLELARKDGTAILGTVTYIGETDGVYSFSVKSATRGSDEFVFKTSTTTSTKSATVTYTAGTEFDQTKSTIVAEPATIDADGVATSTVSVTMYYASDSGKLLTGYTGLELARKDGGAIVGTVTYIGETDGVYSFSVKSATRGSDEFVFKTTSTTSTKSATVTYTAGTEFDQTKSTITASPASIVADNIAESEITVELFYSSDNTKRLSGLTSTQLTLYVNGTQVGNYSPAATFEPSEGVYKFIVKSPTVGSDVWQFQTASTQSNASQTVTYTPGTEFDTTKSTILATPTTIAADNVEESEVTVELFYASDNSKRITGLTTNELSLFIADGSPIGSFTPADVFEPTQGVYKFIVKSDAVGTDAWQFKAGSTSSTAIATINYETNAELLLTVSTKEKEVKIGDVVLFTITAENKGKTTASGFSILESLPAGFSYVANSAALTENPRGNSLSIVGNSPLSLENLSLNSGEKLTLKVILRVGAGVKPGTHKTYVEAFSSTTAKASTVRAFSVADTTSSLTKTSISNRASATILVSDSDPLFSESLIVGTVYHDRNGNGIQDTDEPGIPGVKIVSAEGLIITTDQYGRYHLEGISGGKWDRGRNYILKVDPSSLPEGTKFVSNNPLVRRITPGLPVRFDFGVQLPQAFIMEVSDKLFENGKSEIKATYTNVIKQMAEGIKSNNIKEVIIVTEVKQPLSTQREDALRALLSAYLGEKHAVIVSSMNSAKGAK